MNKTKVVLLGVAILAVGMMVMPYTISSSWYTGGTHDWQYDGVDAAETGTSWDNTWCSRCHGGTTGTDTSATARYHAAQECSDCHDPEWTGKGSNATDDVGTVTHTAITIPTCVQASCHDWVPAEFTADEPHLELYTEALDGSVDGTDTSEIYGKPGTANEACISCHTGVTTSVTFAWSDTVGTITINATGGPTGWTWVDFS